MEEEKKEIKSITLSIDDSYKERFEYIARVTHRKFSSLLRLWIDRDFDEIIKRGVKNGK